MDLNMDILLVDDSSSIRRITKRIFKELGFRNILEGKDGSKALEVLNEEKFDLIIADWNMPKMTGLELLKAVRSDDKTKGTPFLMVTAEAQKQNVIEAVQAGVSNYVVKPFTAESITDKISKIIN